jgi:hypothetical protein
VAASVLLRPVRFEERKAERSKGFWGEGDYSERNIPNLRLTFIASVYLLVLLTVGFWRFADEQPIWDWLFEVAAAFIGTIAAVAVGVYLFNYQSQRADEKREEQLLTVLAGETQANLDTLSQAPSTLKRADGEVVGSVILVRLMFLAAEEAIRSGVFTSKETLFLSKLIANLQIHNEEVSFILSARRGLDETGQVEIEPAHEEAIHYMVIELTLRQADIRTHSKELLRILEEEGIKGPATPDEGTAPETGE